jgi:hypothetical protein
MAGKLEAALRDWFALPALFPPDSPAFRDGAASDGDPAIAVYMIGYECWGVLCPTIPVGEAAARPPGAARDGAEHRA